MQYLVKLVRDKISENSLGDGAKFQRIEDHDIFVEKAREKLIEEAVEYILKPSLTEAADILAILRTLVEEDLGIEEDAMEELIHAAREKEEKRGGFSGRTGLYIEEKESYT